MSNSKLLVVEDDNEAREIVCKILEEYGYTVLGVSTVSMAISAMNLLELDGILLDLKLQGSSVDDLLKGFHHEVIKTPVMIMSSALKSIVELARVSLCAKEVMHKPFSIEELLMKTERLVAA